MIHGTPQRPSQLWRITWAEFADSALSGLGGLHADGRWHRRGQPVVYLAQTWSLAALEVYVHLGRRDWAAPLVYVGIDIPETLPISTLNEEQLPPRWDSHPPSVKTRELGSAWLRQADSALLQVPSVLSPVECNYLLNPLHPDAARLGSSSAQPFRLDARLQERLKA